MWRPLPSQFNNPINPEYEQESRLIEQARAGSERAFAALLARYQQPVFRIIYYLVGNEQEAYDLSYIALKYALRRLPRVPSGISIRPWLLRVAVLVALDAIRERRLSPKELLETLQLPPASASNAERIIDADVAREDTTILQRIDDASANPETAIADAWDNLPIEVERELIRRLLATMPEQDAELLALGVIGQVPTHDLAAIRGTSERSIRRRIARALIVFHRYFIAVRLDALPQSEPVEQLPPPPNFSQHITGKLQQARKGVTEITQQVVHRIKEFGKPGDSTQDARELLQVLRDSDTSNLPTDFLPVEPGEEIVAAAAATTIPIIERTLDQTTDFGIDSDEDILPEELPVMEEAILTADSTGSAAALVSEKTLIVEEVPLPADTFMRLPSAETDLPDDLVATEDPFLASDDMYGEPAVASIDDGILEPIDNTGNEQFEQSSEYTFPYSIPAVIFLPAHIEDLTNQTNNQSNPALQETDTIQTIPDTNLEMFVDSPPLASSAAADDLIIDGESEAEYVADEPLIINETILPQSVLEPVNAAFIPGAIIEDASPIAETMPLFQAVVAHPATATEILHEVQTSEQGDAEQIQLSEQHVLFDDLSLEEIVYLPADMPDTFLREDPADMADDNIHQDLPNTTQDHDDIVFDGIRSDAASDEEYEQTIAVNEDRSTDEDHVPDIQADLQLPDENPHLNQTDLEPIEEGESPHPVTETPRVKIQGIERRNYPPSSRLRKRQRPNHSHRR